MKNVSSRIILITGLIAINLLFTNSILAKDVPLPTKNIIDNAVDGPQFIVPADIDNDGTLDLVGAATDSDEIAWWKNASSNGSMWVKTTLDASFTNAEEVDVADIDHDGDIDVLGAAPDAGGSGEIAWWENLDGTATSWAKHLIADFPDALSVHGADIDNDGDVDVVGANYEGSDIYWWENVDGIGITWNSHMVSDTSLGARSVKTADVDSDGDLDVLSVAVLADEISWWENTSVNGLSWSQHVLDATFDGAYSIQAADLDGDGDLDILGAGQEEDRIAWWENLNGDASVWAEHTITNTFAGARSVFPVDLDQDGDLDVVGAAFESNTVAWWENVTGDASTWVEHILDNTFGNAISVYPADIDSDGDPDVVAAAELDDTIAWWENETIHGEAVYPHEFTHMISGSVDGAVWSETADMDKDGDLDVVSAAYGVGVISWWENIDSHDPNWIEHIVDDTLSHPYMIHSSDIDQDGDLDLVAIIIDDPIQEQLIWWENLNGIGTNWIKHAIGPLRRTLSVKVVDLDTDGDADLVTTNFLNFPSPGVNITWWENSASDGSIWLSHDITTGLWLRPVNIADVDGDGDPDILGGENNGDSFYWWENISADALIWDQHEIDDAFQQVTYLFPEDMDRDGDVDIVGSARASDQIAWWENISGNGTVWSKHLIDAAFDGADHVFVTDLDADGDPDVLGAALEADAFYWWENISGDSLVWVKHFISVGGNATSIEAADLDRDGDLDILGAAFNDDSIQWWENRGGQFSLPTTDSSPSGVNAGSQDDMLQIVATHNGRSGDNAIELTTFELLLEEIAGDPLTNTEANAIVENLHIYLDDGSGVFEEDIDTWITAVDTLDLSAGRQTVQFLDDDPDIRFGWQAPRTYFVVVELALDLVDDPNRNGVTTLRLTHITEASSTAQDQLYNIPLSLTYAPNVSAQIDLLSPTVVSLQSIGIRETAVPFWLIALVLGGLLLIGSYFYHLSSKRN